MLYFLSSVLSPFSDISCLEMTSLHATSGQEFIFKIIIVLMLSYYHTLQELISLLNLSPFSGLLCNNFFTLPRFLPFTNWMFQERSNKPVVKQNLYLVFDILLITQHRNRMLFFSSHLLFIIKYPSNINTIMITINKGNSNNNSNKS